MRRVSVVGVTGSGKTTFASALAERLGVPHIELDALHWDPNWTMAELAVFRTRVAAAVEAESWVADGNYPKVRDLVWARADTVVWLDYPFPLIYGRLLRRTFRRIRTGEELWNGTRERIRNLFERDSVLIWAIRTYPRNRRAFPQDLASDEYQHLRVVRHRSPSEAEAWLAGLDQL